MAEFGRWLIGLAGQAMVFAAAFVVMWAGMRFLPHRRKPRKRAARLFARRGWLAPLELWWRCDECNKLVRPVAHGEGLDARVKHNCYDCLGFLDPGHIRVEP